MSEGNKQRETKRLMHTFEADPDVHEMLLAAQSALPGIVEVRLVNETLREGLVRVVERLLAERRSLEQDGMAALREAAGTGGVSARTLQPVTYRRKPRGRKAGGDA